MLLLVNIQVALSHLCRNSNISVLVLVFRPSQLLIWYLHLAMSFLDFMYIRVCLRLPPAF